jgi:hypothetical protein
MEDLGRAAAARRIGGSKKSGHRWRLPGTYNVRRWFDERFGADGMGGGRRTGRAVGDTVTAPMLVPA